MQSFRANVLSLVLVLSGVLSGVSSGASSEVATPAPPVGQSRDAPIPHDTGQSVSPSFEGWYPNDDGTFTLSFGYFNRNFQ